MQENVISYEQDLCDSEKNILFITDLLFSVLWISPAAQEMLPMLRIQDNLFDVFPQKKELLEECVQKLKKNNIWTFDCLYGQENETIRLIVKKAENDQKYLWYVHKTEDIFLDLMKHFSAEDEIGLVQIGKIYRESVFHIFNSLYSMREVADVGLINNIARNCYQIHRATVNLEQYALAKSHRLECNFQLLSVQHLLEMTINDIKRFSTFPADKLEYCVEDKGLLAMIDLKLFNIALFNILSNAYEASVPEGKIIITLSKQGNDVVISVSDEGVGIDKRNLAQVFEPFFFCDDDGEKGYTASHAGLGLSVAKEIIEAHSGTLLLSSKQNQGTMVVIRVPCVTKIVPGTKLLEPKFHPADKLSDFYVFLANSCNLDIF